MNNQQFLLISLFFCHYLADYTPLLTLRMLKAKALGKPTLPIFIHASVHALLMFIVLLLFEVELLTALYLWLFQLTTHFLIDLLKGRLNYWFPTLQNNMSKMHWVVFGFDQFLHAVVIIVMVYYTKI